jgi:hypothetical protein
LQKTALKSDGIIKSKDENSTFWTLTVISDDNEKSYKEAVLKILRFATEERIVSHGCPMGQVKKKKLSYLLKVIFYNKNLLLYHFY